MGYKNYSGVLDIFDFSAQLIKFGAKFYPQLHSWRFMTKIFKTSDRSKITIYLDRLETNIAQIKEISKNCEICAVIKANAYGHGAVEVSEKLTSIGVNWLAVASLNEAISIRKLNNTEPNILLLGPIDISDIKNIAKFRLTPNIYSLTLLKELAVSVTKELQFHLEIDTGMSRTGIPVKELNKAISILKKNKSLIPTGIFSHLACADLVDHPFNLTQISRFLEALKLFKENDVKPQFAHLANSAAIFSYEDAKFNFVRAGLAMYGVSPFNEAQIKQLRPVMQWTTQPLQIRNLSNGDPVSYNCTWRAKGNRRIAVIPVGYADGYFRLISNRGHILVNGIEAPIVGNVCMDLTMADITECGEVSEESEVVLLGEQRGKSILASDIAKWADTIPYEVLCNIGRRSGFDYRDSIKEDML